MTEDLDGVHERDWMQSLYFCACRLRVKDINDAIKELGQMISMHTGSTQPMTRLMIVQEAVSVITGLEQRLRGMLWHGQPPLCLHPWRIARRMNACAAIYLLYVAIQMHVPLILLIIAWGKHVTVYLIQYMACHLEHHQRTVLDLPFDSAIWFWSVYGWVSLKFSECFIKALKIDETLSILSI